MSLLKLTKSNFTGTLLNGAENQIVLILFKAEWCGHCQNFLPTFKKLTENLNSNQLCAVVDADEESELINQINSFIYGYKVQGFPTLVLYHDGKFIKTYEGDRSIEDLLEFMNN